MKNAKWRTIVFSFVALSFLFVTGCNFDLTTGLVPTNTTTEQSETTTEDLTTLVTTTEELTSTDTQITIITTTESTVTTTEEPVTTTEEPITTTEEPITTTEEPITTTEEQTTTTELLNTEYEKIDELILSLDRLENADFTINTKFVDEYESPQPVKRPLGYYRQAILLSTTSIIDNQEVVINPEDYVQDDEQTYIYYNKALIDTPILENGMYRVSESLDGRTIFNLYDFVTSLSNVATISKSQVDWAVENLKVMNTWVRCPSFDYTSDNKFLLEYDVDNDIVSLYNYYRRTDELKIDSFNKISVYYNDLGEKVIETWQAIEFYEGTHTDGTVQNFMYFNSIAGRDYNVSSISIDDSGEYMGNYMLRGVNLDDDGNYKFYENYYTEDRNYIKGINGWFQYSPNIDYETGMITPSENNYHSVSSPDLGNEAFSIYQTQDKYIVYLSLSAFDGDIAALYDENCLSQGNIYGIQSYNKYYSTTSAHAGLETVNGTYLTTDSSWNNKVKFYNIFSSADKESRILYDQYFNYYTVMQLHIYTNSIDEAMLNLHNYLDYIGLTYRFGSNSDLLNEYGNFYNNVEDYVSTFPITNDVIGYNGYTYSSTEAYENTMDYLIEYTNIIDNSKELLINCPSIDKSEQPIINDFSNVVLINMDNVLTGTTTINIDSLSIDISSLDITLNKTPLLQNNQQYSVFYAYMIGGKIYPFYQGQSETFNDNDIIFDVNSPVNIGLTSNLPEGEYSIVAFIGKIIDDKYIRISTISPLLVDSFIDQAATADIGNGYNGVFNFSYQNGNIVVTKQNFDVEGPSFELIPDQTIEAGTADIDWTIIMYNLSDNSGGVSTLLEEIDNVDYNTPGTYTVTVSATDESLNVTSQTFNVIVEDTISPSFDFINDQTIEVGTEDIDWTTYILNESDNSDGVLTLLEEVDNIDYNTPGTYTVTVSATDESLNVTSQTFNVIVEDTISPSFDFINDQTIEAGTEDIDWTTYILNESDNSDGVLTLLEEVDNVDYNTPGTYTVTVSATDESLNVATQTFNITVVETN
jgi:hypothetical protein